MTIHIDYDREENKIELILESQGNVIRTLAKNLQFYFQSPKSFIPQKVVTNFKIGIGKSLKIKIA